MNMRCNWKYRAEIESHGPNSVTFIQLSSLHLRQAQSCALNQPVCCPADSWSLALDTRDLRAMFRHKQRSVSRQDHTRAHPARQPSTDDTDQEGALGGVNQQKTKLVLEQHWHQCQGQQED